MYLHEYQSKKYFARFGIPTLQGQTAVSPLQAAQVADDIGLPVVINAQSFADQRFFRPANSLTEVEHIARDILALTLQGQRVQTLLIESAVDVAAEYFLGFYADRGSQLLLVAAAESGGRFTQPERPPLATLIHEEIDPFLGVLEYQARNLANSINLPREHWDTFTQIARSLYRCAEASDAIHAEINPLALTHEGELIALGGRLVIDDNALFRQPEIVALGNTNADPAATDAVPVTHVRLNGTVSCIFSGAGLGLATLDLLARHGLSAGDFLDLGGSLQTEAISAALRLVAPEAQIILINLFADKLRCPELAYDVLAALAEARPTAPLVIRLAGQDAAAGLALLQSSSQIATATSEAVHLAADIAKGIPHVHPGG